LLNGDADEQEAEAAAAAEDAQPPEVDDEPPDDVVEPEPDDEPEVVDAADTSPFPPAPPSPFTPTDGIPGERHAPPATAVSQYAPGVQSVEYGGETYDMVDDVPAPAPEPEPAPAPQPVESVTSTPVPQAGVEPEVAAVLGFRMQTSRFDKPPVGPDLAHVLFSRPHRLTYPVTQPDGSVATGMTSERKPGPLYGALINPKTYAITAWTDHEAHLRARGEQPRHRARYTPSSDPDVGSLQIGQLPGGIHNALARICANDENWDTLDDARAIYEKWIDEARKRYLAR
jgi:hypothetical protein